MSERERPATYCFFDEHFERCVQLIERSGIVKMIETYHRMHRGPGGRTPTGRRYTLTAVFATQLAILSGVARVPSYAETARQIDVLSDAQTVRVGMDPSNRSLVQSDYKAMLGWLSRMLAPLDPGADLPARRVSNKAHREQIAGRSEEQQVASDLARQRLHDIVNALLAASITIDIPTDGEVCRMVDETTVDLARPDRELGSRDDKLRGAASMGRYYVRDAIDNAVHTDGAKVRKTKKHGFGIGVTALSVGGPPQHPTKIPALFTAAAIDHPTSASVEALATVISYHKLHGFDPERGQRARAPYLVVDMGYNPKVRFNDVVLDAGYAPVVRYPAHFHTVWASDSAEHGYGGVSAGPVQIAGDFYCPVAQQVLGNDRMIKRTEDIKKAKNDGFDKHDRLLERMFPLLMGLNSRPYRKRSRPGRRGRAQDDAKQSVRMDLVCPAVQGRVRCPLKPASLDNDDPQVPLLEPAWSADRYRCCQGSQLTVSLSKDQWRMAQWGGLVPGSWEHTLYYETVRSATERQFSKLKSPHISGFEHLTWSARREPAISILIGLWFAATNMATEDAFIARGPAESSVRYRMRQLAEDLGHPPTRIPPRT
ncbi:hypothetical protein BJF89_10315 [Corynebacterium sp. CNJ-954]|uniref:hypothetical protein n=1 Tax=Corynebacterium sp. CNJ-954 TaxID=1904962 RepID=UPI00095A602C|nr:hypothetical protein [Corynebacterium sp. CNJ-954]OLT50299.1 hypothetical protein BJF89_10315 [Corynebacterium sp. CNJ-954]